MGGKTIEIRVKVPGARAGWVLLAGVLSLAVVLAGGSAERVGAAVVTAKVAPNVTCPSGQCFADVPASSSFFAYVNNLYMDGIVSGYDCGGVGEPCDADSRPYYRPVANVTRQQMSKFEDLGRRNIADAVGTSLDIDSSANRAIHARTTTGSAAIVGECLQQNIACFGIQGIAPAGDYAGYFQGGLGIYAQSNDVNKPGAYIISSEGGAYGAEVHGVNYRGEYVNSMTAGYISMYVDQANSGVTDLYVNSGAEVVGNLIVDGSKSGYVVDVMQNVGDSPLEPGDVVVMVGSGAPVLGQIPVVLVKKTTTAYDGSVAGVVDQVLYVPDPATRAAYKAQEEARRAAREAQDMAIAAAEAQGTKPDLSEIVVPDAKISDDVGNLHALPDANSAASGSYLNVVTLGSYKGVKVDASFGPIHVGDMLTTSPHSGYAMKVTDKSQALGTVIGKAMADVESGTGVIPVMVTLK